MRAAFLALLLCLVGVYADDLQWWQSAVIYQIYPRSFKDTDGDGYGDLNGIQKKISYLKELGVDAVWISPIYPSPGKDFGYDISDYTAIDPLFGTMEDFENLLQDLHDNDIKLIMDFVPNHSSNEHNWFKQSCSNVTEYADYYVWREGPNETTPPNNWLSNYDESAWTYVESRKKFYLHQFLKEQPDLNYLNPKVQDAMNGVLTFWLDKGVDGFRMDAVYTISETGFLDEPSNPNCDTKTYGCLDHIYTVDQDGTYEVLTNFRHVIDQYSKKGPQRVMMTESYTKDWSKVVRYYKNNGNDVANFPFNFMIIMDLHSSNSGQDWSNEINNWYDQTQDYGWANWVMGNHDQSRVASRVGPALIDGVNMIALILKGTAVTYNGEELGMVNSYVRWDEAKDPQGISAGILNFKSRSRDPNRGPMIWTSDQNAGFTTASKSWLPIDSGYWRYNVDLQKADDASHLTTYKRMLRLRKTLLWQYGDCIVQTVNGPDVLGILRRNATGDFSTVTLVNFGEGNQNINLHSAFTPIPNPVYLYAQSSGLQWKVGDTLDSNNILLPSKAAVTVFTQPLSRPIAINSTCSMAPQDFLNKDEATCL